ncbi:MAG: PA14 domain-containing protein [Limisphaerales bacterium]
MKKLLLCLCFGILALWTSNGSAADKTQPGLQAEFFAFDNEIEDFPAIPAGKKPTVQRVDKTVDVDAGDGAWPGTELSEHFYIRWTGKLRIPQDGKYTFFLNSDDGSRLFIGGKQVVDNGGLHSADEKSEEVELKAGDHDLKLEFFQNEGEAVCKFSWQPPGKDKEIVPASVLSH